MFPFGLKKSNLGHFPFQKPPTQTAVALCRLRYLPPHSPFGEHPSCNMHRMRRKSVQVALFEARICEKGVDMLQLLEETVLAPGNLRDVKSTF
jgi:hypothetical protein